MHDANAPAGQAGSEKTKCRGVKNYDRFECNVNLGIHLNVREKNVLLCVSSTRVHEGRKDYNASHEPPHVVGRREQSLLACDPGSEL